MKTPTTRTEALDYLCCLRIDLEMLQAGEWAPDDASIDASSDDHISIIDYKDGMGVVEANGNKQLEQYAVGVMSEWRC